MVDIISGGMGEEWEIENTGVGRWSLQNVGLSCMPIEKGVY